MKKIVLFSVVVIVGSVIAGFIDAMIGVSLKDYSLLQTVVHNGALLTLGATLFLVLTKKEN